MKQEFAVAVNLKEESTYASGRLFNWMSQVRAYSLRDVFLPIHINASGLTTNGFRDDRFLDPEGKRSGPLPRDSPLARPYSTRPPTGIVPLFPWLTWHCPQCSTGKPAIDPPSESGAETSLSNGALKYPRNNLFYTLNLWLQRDP